MNPAAGPDVRKRRSLAVLLAVLMTFALVAPAAQAINFTRDGDQVALVTKDRCPTLTSPPDYFEAWLNTDDMERRGFLDPKDHAPWSFATRMAQVICGAESGSTITIGFYFIRALGTMTELGDGTRPESDPEQVWKALEYVVKKRGVKAGIVIDSDATVSTSWALVEKRLVATNIAQVYRCKNGCFNTNKSSVFPYAINHEKFITISDTIWDKSGGVHPVLLQSSGNIARSQIRTYLQEAAMFYDDRDLHDFVVQRYQGMVACASSGCATNAGFPSELKAGTTKSRGIWVDKYVRHYTDAGRGTAVAFSPQPTSTLDYYVEQFDDVDCEVDNKIRVAMFKLTDTKSKQMVESLVRLKKRGCDVKMLISRSYGALVLSKDVLSLLSKNKIPYKCSPFPMHTKLILIGPENNNNGRILVGTANMSVAGLRYSEEHVVTIDSRRASPKYQESIRRVYGEYMTGWYELSQGGRSCK